jgi:hypothetical protein
VEAAMAAAATVGWPAWAHTHTFRVTAARQTWFERAVTQMVEGARHRLMRDLLPDRMCILIIRAEYVGSEVPRVARTHRVASLF